MIEAFVNFIVLDPIVPDEKTESGLIIVEEERSIKSQVEMGKVLSMGPGAFLDPALGGEAQCDDGDTVIFAKYAAKWVADPKEKKDDGSPKVYLVVRDSDIIGRVA